MVNAAKLWNPTENCRRVFRGFTALANERYWWKARGKDEHLSFDRNVLRPLQSAWTTIAFFSD